MIQTGPEPFFTNDAAGYVRVLFAFVLGMSPLFGLVVWFLRKGPDERITRVENDLTRLGAKVDDMGRDAAADRARMIEFQREIADNHREQLDMLRTSSAAITSEVHKVDVRMARIEERSDIAEAFDRFGQRIERALLKTTQHGD